MKTNISGIVIQKRITNKGNIIMTIKNKADESKVLFMAGNELLIKRALDIRCDDIIGVKGRKLNIFVVASELTVLNKR